MACPQSQAPAQYPRAASAARAPRPAGSQTNSALLTTQGALGAAPVSIQCSGFLGSCFGTFPLQVREALNFYSFEVKRHYFVLRTSLLSHDEAIRKKKAARLNAHARKPAQPPSPRTPPCSHRGKGMASTAKSSCRATSKHHLQTFWAQTSALHIHSPAVAQATWEPGTAGARNGAPAPQN